MPASLKTPDKLPAGVWQGLLQHAYSLIDEIAVHGIQNPFRLTPDIVNAHSMRITQSGVFKMETGAASTRKRPVNLTINEALVAQAKAYTNNLSATVETLLTEFVANQQSAQRNRQNVADTCAADWNGVHAAVGSFADEHSTL